MIKFYYQYESDDSRRAGVWDCRQLPGENRAEKLIDTLTEVRKYSEDLRAQTHEFSNKLYAILGSLELGEYDEAIELIKEEYAIQNEQHDILFQNIHSRQVQAILLGKISKASEKRSSCLLMRTARSRLFLHISACPISLRLLAT